MQKLSFSELYELVLLCDGSFSYIMRNDDQMSYDKDMDAVVPAISLLRLIAFMMKKQEVN